MAFLEQGQVQYNRFVAFENIDAQDEQDQRDESFLHEKPAQAMIRSGFTDSPISGHQNLKTISCISCLSCASMLIIQ